MSTANNNGPDVQLNLNVRGLKPSATVSINDYSNELRRQGREIYKLGLGQSPFPVPDSVVRALQANAHQKDYLPASGLAELRRAVADHNNRTYGTKTTADNVLIGPGSKELMFLLQLCYYGDILIPSPSWVSYAPQARIIGRQIEWIRTKMENDWFPTPDQIDILCRDDPGRPRILVLNYPSNPTGKTLSRERLTELAEVARHYKVIILSDEIYGKIHHEGTQDSIMNHYPEGTIFSSGLSKWCGAGGWRLGLFVFPDSMRWLQKAMTSVASETFTSTSTPIQHAAVTAFEEGPEIEEYLVHTRRVLKAIGNMLTDMLADAGASILHPDGAFYLFPDFSPLKKKLRARGIRTSAEMCERILRDVGVAVLPGKDFGRRPDELTMRISYVDFDGGGALAASRKLPLGQTLDEDFVRQNAQRCVVAVERLCDWANTGV